MLYHLQSRIKFQYRRQRDTRCNNGLGTAVGAPNLSPKLVQFFHSHASIHILYLECVCVIYYRTVTSDVGRAARRAWKATSNRPCLTLADQLGPGRVKCLTTVGMCPCLAPDGTPWTLSYIFHDLIGLLAESGMAGLIWSATCCALNRNPFLDAPSQCLGAPRDFLPS